jgi:hypothetical protein
VSVLMVLTVPGADGAAMERAVDQDREKFLAIAERAKSRGAIHHAFYEGDGKIIVVDEWDSPESFHAFFEAEAGTIGPLMQAAGAGEPEPPQFYRKVSLGDEF